MKKVIIKDKDGVQKAGAEMLDPSQWIAECVASNSWGLPEREELDEMGKQTGVILPAEYTIEIIDVSQEHALREVIQKRIAEYPSAADFLNAYFDGGLDLLREKRLAVKAKYPKP
jgi:hypothetical protein